ncbi:hypothetical protein AtEden1_Chr3g0182771 [Arabidopsis thaliana]
MWLVYAILAYCSDPNPLCPNSQVREVTLLTTFLFPFFFFLFLQYCIMDVFAHSP